jgi:beta-glucosidase
VTFYRSLSDLPPFDDYRMEGHTYRYFRGEPLFPFGHGLSYTRFAYSDLDCASSIPAGEAVTISVNVRNAGQRAGDEVVQLYVSDLEASVPVPIRQLAGFRRIHLAPGEAQNVSFTLRPRQFSLIDDAGRRVIEPGTFRIAVGGRQPRAEDETAPGADVLLSTLRVTGSIVEVPGA